MARTRENATPATDATEGQGQANVGSNTVEIVSERAEPIWGENNQLVHPELDDHFKVQAEIVLGKRDPVTHEVYGEGEGAKFAPSSPNMPFVNQQHDSQTRDPLTSPTATADPNTMPSPLTPMTEGAREIDEAMMRGAQVMDEVRAGAPGNEQVEVLVVPPPSKIDDPGPTDPQPNDGSADVFADANQLHGQTSGAPDREPTE